MLVGALAAAMSTIFAVTLGALSALIGGPFDSAVLLLTDVVLTIPYIVFLGVLAVYVKLDSPILLALIIAAVAWPTLLRAVRAQVLSLKEREYVEAARVLDLGTGHILFREVLPNMTSFIVINFVIAMTNAIYGQIILYFFGLVPMVDDNWGLMIQFAFTKGAIYFKDSLSVHHVADHRHLPAAALAGADRPLAGRDLQSAIAGGVTDGGCRVTGDG